jgi:hypothetical protein
MLRVVRLPETAVEPAPASLDTGNALDRCMRRDGWLVFTPDLDVWGMPLPFSEPFLVARRTRVVPGVDARTVWLHPWDGSTIVEYDGVAREARRELELPGPQFSLQAVTRSGFVLQADEADDLFAWSPPDEPETLLTGVGPVLGEGAREAPVACLSFSTRELVLVNDGGATVTVPQPEGWLWDSVGLGVFSPDGAWLAVDLCDASERTQTLAWWREYEPKPHSLGIVRCADGAMTIATGVYDNFAKIAWSLDAEWIVLSTPFAPHGLWLTRRADAELTWLSFKDRGAPSLLCDVSDLVD